MPTYQYACTECGHAFEQVQSFTDDALTECPECQGRLRKVFNAVGVVFKGSGFYRTDSREKESSLRDRRASASQVRLGARAAATSESTRRPRPSRRADVRLVGLVRRPPSLPADRQLTGCGEPAAAAAPVGARS